LGDHEQVPLERTAEIAVGVLPADDVTAGVLANRVGRIHTGLTRATTVGVVGQRAVLPAVGSGRDPLGAVHLRGAREVSRQARVHENLVDGPRRKRRVARAQLEPVAGAVVIEARRIERALIERALASGEHLLVVAR